MDVLVVAVVVLAPCVAATVPVPVVDGTISSHVWYGRICMRVS